MRISDWSSDVCSSDLTAAYSDAIFGLFWLLGYRFSPRLADIGGAKLWRIDRQASYGQFDEIAWGRIKINLIRENRSEEHTSELQSLMRISYAVFCLKKKNTDIHNYSRKEHIKTHYN